MQMKPTRDPRRGKSVVQRWRSAFTSWTAPSKRSSSPKPKRRNSSGNRPIHPICSLNPGFSRIPVDYADLVELTEAEFHQCVPTNAPTLVQRRDRHLKVGDLMVSFLRLRMMGGSDVYLMREALVKLPAENQSFMQRFLSKGTYGIRLREGGYGLLNLQNLLGYTVYPGVPELPADTWMARPKAT